LIIIRFWRKVLQRIPRKYLLFFLIPGIPIAIGYFNDSILVRNKPVIPVIIDPGIQ